MFAFVSSNDRQITYADQTIFEDDAQIDYHVAFYNGRVYAQIDTVFHGEENSACSHVE
jgi:hypothetical protein